MDDHIDVRGTAAYFASGLRDVVSAIHQPCGSYWFLCFHGFVIKYARNICSAQDKVKHNGKKMARENLKKKEISSRIALAVERSGRKAKDIAAALGVSEVTMSKYVNGVSTPKNDYLLDLAQELNVSVSWLLSGDDEVYAAAGSPTYEEWKQRALKAEKQLENLKKVLPLISEANAILSKNF